MLHALFVGLAPRRIFNVNSRLCWNAFQRFGARLVRDIDLFGWFFCWDRSDGGARVGYPSDFYPVTAPFMTAIVTDSHFLRNELLQLYRPPTGLREKLVTLHSPTRVEARRPVAAESSAQSAHLRDRPLILWAGRFDRQKRFDLVQEIARLMPDVDFRCWGKPLLDAPPDLTDLPANVQINPPFKSLDELPLQASDGWLYTSEWDGFPNILVELAYQGAPVVASAVEGVHELVCQETGWPVARWNEPAAYVEALREMIASPQLRIERAQAFQALAIRECSTDRFDRDLGHLIFREQPR